MGFIKNKLFIFITFILLQSCSGGGGVGKFFESSFKNIQETKIKEDLNSNLKKKIVIKSGGIAEKNKNIEVIKMKEDLKNNLKIKVSKMSEKKSKNNKKISNKNIFLQNKVYQPKSYKIIFILKDVDPKDPTEDLRTCLLYTSDAADE